MSAAAWFAIVMTAIIAVLIVLAVASCLGSKPAPPKKRARRCGGAHV